MKSDAEYTRPLTFTRLLLYRPTQVKDHIVTHNRQAFVFNIPKMTSSLIGREVMIDSAVRELQWVTEESVPAMQGSIIVKRPICAFARTL